MIEPAAKNSWAAPAILGVIGLAIGVFAGMKLAPQKPFEIGGQPALQFMAQNRFVSKEMHDSQRGFLIDVDNKLKSSGAIDFPQWAELLEKHRFAFACVDGPCHLPPYMCCNGVDVSGYFVPLPGWAGSGPISADCPKVEVFDLQGLISCPNGWEITPEKAVVVKTQELINCGAYRLEVVCGTHRTVKWTLGG